MPFSPLCRLVIEVLWSLNEELLIYQTCEWNHVVLHLDCSGLQRFASQLLLLQTAAVQSAPPLRSITDLLPQWSATDLLTCWPDPLFISFPFCPSTAYSGLTQHDCFKPRPPSPTFAPFSGLDQSEGGARRRWRSRGRRMVSCGDDAVGNSWILTRLKGLQGNNRLNESWSDDWAPAHNPAGIMLYEPTIYRNTTSILGLIKDSTRDCRPFPAANTADNYSYSRLKKRGLLVKRWYNCYILGVFKT